jgi:hypothetical protein
MATFNNAGLQLQHYPGYVEMVYLTLEYSQNSLSKYRKTSYYCFKFSDGNIV